MLAGSVYGSKWDYKIKIGKWVYTMNETYIILIKRKNGTGANIEDIEKYFKTRFKSYDYMMGFLDGYCFDNFRVVKLADFEKSYNNNSPTLEKYFIKFVKIVGIED